MPDRDTYIRVMMKPEEKSEINRAADCIGETLSSYVRRIMLQAARKDNREHAA